jgi:hypothetical protein
MSDTIAIPGDFLAEANFDRLPPHGQGGNPLCPACHLGRLHPFVVTFSTNQGRNVRYRGVDYLQGWVAVCQGAKAAHGVAAQDMAPCGFSMPLTPGRFSDD